MAIVIWLIVGLALWHLTIFVPDHFWGGIVGALLGAVGGALISGAIVQVILGRGLNDVDMVTFFAAIPGFLLGAWLVYWIGERNEDPEFQLQD
jgi:tetrahydromethanopterin S-methyltransferase subunit D